VSLEAEVFHGNGTPELCLLREESRMRKRVVPDPRARRRGADILCFRLAQSLAGGPQSADAL
jgi:hypothetical protein